MQYRRFGRTEQQLSVFSLGTMRLVQCSEEVAERTIACALDRGINHLETAQAYGNSEVRLGKVFAGPLKGWRARLFITTKLVPTSNPDDLRRGLERSLERLQCDRIDNFAFHGINLPEHLDLVLSSNLQVMRQAQSEGLVGHVGFSTHGSLELILRAIATDEFDFVNLHYYFFNQRNGEAIAKADERDMGIFIISPADKGGMLYRPPERLERLCAPLTPLEFGYRFLLNDDRVHTLSLGASLPEEVETALRTLETSGDVKAIALEIENTSRERLGGDRCSQCYACLPCPESINIPEILRLRNLAKAIDMTEYGQYRYNMLENAGHWFPGTKGDNCTDCGDCLPRCPERLNIPDLLRDTHDRLNRNPIRRLWE
ncbi:MAG: aldo/keto reductase [Cyanobacteria bacterium J06648_11]